MYKCTDEESSVYDSFRLVMESEYQSEHTQFVSGHNGSDPLEILMIGAPVHCSHLLLISLHQLLGCNYSTVAGRVLEWLVLVCPTLLCLTVWCEQVVTVTLSTAALACIIIFSSQHSRVNGQVQAWNNNKSMFVMNHRSLMIIFTTVGILAVDFPVFPRRFAKTETVGFGWMDLGVGSFTFVNGLVSPEARGHRSSLLKNVSGCVPLMMLGLVRLVSVWVLGYHDHVSEYGVHWNFFFTLAAVRLLSSLILLVIHETKTVWVTSLVIAVMYEGVLTFGLADWILSDTTPRDDLISANREGLSSSLGYLAIYLAGVSWGREVFNYNKSVEELLVMLKLLLLWGAMMWLSLVYCMTFFLPPSRRLANYAFFTWIIAYNITVLTMFLITDLIVLCCISSSSGVKNKSKPKNQKNRAASEHKSKVELYRCPKLVEAVDYNPLTFFLLSNLLTGLVNMSIRTIHTSDTLAVIILLSYQAVLALVISLLYKFQIKIKFW